MKPAQVSETLIEAIKRNMEHGDVTLKSERFRKEQVVYIKGGPLAGIEAVFGRELPE